MVKSNHNWRKMKVNYLVDVHFCVTLLPHPSSKNKKQNLQSKHGFPFAKKIQAQKSQIILSSLNQYCQLLWFQAHEKKNRDGIEIFFDFWLPWFFNPASQTCSSKNKENSITIFFPTLLSLRSYHQILPTYQTTQLNQNIAVHEKKKLASVNPKQPVLN